jgi:hypothetical protein
MKYLISETGEIFAFEADGSQDGFIPQGLTPLTADEAELHIAALTPPPTLDQRRAATSMQKPDFCRALYQIGRAHV